MKAAGWFSASSASSHIFLRSALAANVAVLLAGVLPIAGCGGKGSAIVQSGSVVIFTQPTNQAVPIGRTATFTVGATTSPTSAGTHPLTYQWIKNGVALPEATASSYTTPTVSLADNGTQYQVTVTSGSDSVTSAVAILTAGPRAPGAGDVRYLLWQQAGPQIENAPIGIGQLGDGQGYINNALGTPLSLGANANHPSCGWDYNYLGLPSSMGGQFTTYYQSDNTQTQESWQSYLESINNPNVVIFSADLEPSCRTIGVAWVQVQAGGFDYKLEEVAPSAVSATIVNDGSASRIVTAAIYDSASKEWALISYGWQGDTGTVYESQSAIVTGTQVWSEAQTLANQGYFISAVGGNNTHGYLMVGMRVQGDTLPRPIQYGNSGVPANADNAFWTAIAYLGSFMTEQ